MKTRFCEPVGTACGLPPCSRRGNWLVMNGILMADQHAKWLKSSRAIAWRRPVESRNDLPTPHAWRQDHDGFSRQDPGFNDHVANKTADVARVCLPPAHRRRTFPDSATLTEFTEQA